jgi:hypothetical protein
MKFDFEKVFPNDPASSEGSQFICITLDSVRGLYKGIEALCHLAFGLLSEQSLNVY